MAFSSFSSCLAPVVVVVVKEGVQELEAWKKLQSADAVAQLVEVEAEVGAPQISKAQQSVEVVLAQLAVTVWIIITPVPVVSGFNLR